VYCINELSCGPDQPALTEAFIQSCKASRKAVRVGYLEDRLLKVVRRRTSN
jgi:hypothetical protein